MRWDRRCRRVKYYRYRLRSVAHLVLRTGTLSVLLRGYVALDSTCAQTPPGSSCRRDEAPQRAAKHCLRSGPSLVMALVP